jgi:4-amino-4-deoxy-L-arabinose transferase-like glycosyltransferase
LLLLATGAFHAAVASTLGMSVDESYAVVMSRHWQLSYFDHPPLLFWITGITVRLLGREEPWAVRLPFVLAFLLTTWLVHRIGAWLFDERAGFWAALVLNLALFFTVNAACCVVPDAPLLLWSAAAGLCFAAATIGPRRLGDEGVTPRRPIPPGVWWAGYGLFSGFALLSKYHGVFLLAGGALYLVTSKEHRRWLRRPEPYLAVLLAAFVFLPVVVWNAGHDFASFRFQGSRAFPSAGQGGTPMLATLLGQAAWILPWIWVPLLATLGTALRRGPRDSPRWLLLCLAIGPIAFFTLDAALRGGLAHWQAPGYFMLLPALGAAIATRLDRGDRLVRRWLWASVAGLALVLALVLGQSRTGWATDLAPWFHRLRDPTDDLVQWQPVVAQLRAWGYPRKGVTIAGGTWADAAKLSYAFGPKVRVASVGDDPRGFEFVEPQEDLVGHDVVIVTRRRPGPEPMVLFTPYFEHITGLGTVPVLRAGQEEIAVSVYLGRNLLRPVPAGIFRSGRDRTRGDGRGEGVVSQATAVGSGLR